MDTEKGSRGIWFPQWAEVLARVRLPALQRQTYRQAVVAYLRYCKDSRQRATVASARAFMVQVEGQRRLGSSQLATWKEALNWFFREAAASPNSQSAIANSPLPGQINVERWTFGVED